MQAVVGGTASSGVIICLLRVVTKAALPPTRAGLRTSTAIYFALSGVICLLCFFVYYSVLPRLGVVRYYKMAAKGILCCFAAAHAQSHCCC
jgi:equilibrative nucleoside transporter 1/2/3